jgi:cytidylate kinase
MPLPAAQVLLAAGAGGMHAMIALTIDGQTGAGAFEVGQIAARNLDARYIQHLAVRRMARRLGATVGAVSHKELSFARSQLMRLAYSLQAAFERMGYYSYDPSGVIASPLLLPQRPPQLKTLPGQISDAAYLEAANAVAGEFMSEGNLVLVKRAGCATLRRFPEVTHVGLFAADDFRVRRVARRLEIGHLEASEIVAALDSARRAWFRKLGAADPADPSNYDLKVHTDLGEPDGSVALRIVEEVGGPRFRVEQLRDYPEDLTLGATA